MTTPNEASPGRSEAVAVIIAALIAIYGISQFLRSSVGVIASDLARELGLSATEIGLLSSAFFFSFAAAQIPVGIAIDRYGPKRTLVATATLAIAGTVLFAAAPVAVGADPRPDPDGARLLDLSHGPADDLRPALPARALRAADQPADGLRQSRHPRGDRAARGRRRRRSAGAPRS
jgi:hypothetical protein